MTSSLSVVVLAWNQADLTRRCLESIRSHTDVAYELIVVDNGSDQEARSMASNLADIAVLNDSNLGFAKGMNRGLTAATGEFVAFVNNDTVLPEHWASRLLEDFDNWERAGIVLPAVTAAGNPVSVRSQPGDRVLPLRRFIDLASGVVYVMRREIAEQLGGWDERYEIASREDLDLLFAVWCNDLEVILDERVLVEHESNVTAKAQLPNRDSIWERNWEVFVEKWTEARPANIQRTTLVDADRFDANLVTAATATHWMDRWYQAWNGERALRRQLRDADRSRATFPVDPSPAPSSWGRLRSRFNSKRG